MTIQQTRLDATQVEVVTDHLTCRIYANQAIHLEASALDELERFSATPGILNLAFSPDFHKAAGAPVGTVALIDRVYPQVTGNDLGCGMRLDVTSRSALTITDALKDDLRHAFFGGGREILNHDRKAMLATGLKGLRLTPTRSVARIPAGLPDQGCLGDGDVAPLLAPYYDNPRERDNFLGSIGGGNHFVELQIVDEIVDKQAAYRLGLALGKICVMSHSGSLDLGHAVGNYYRDKAISEWQGRKPENGFIPLSDAQGRAYLRAGYNAANFAMANRAVMNAMVADVLETDLRPVYDAPHNLIWQTPEGYLHRKGACPAALDEVVIACLREKLPALAGRGIAQGAKRRLTIYARRLYNVRDERRTTIPHQCWGCF